MEGGVTVLFGRALRGEATGVNLEGDAIGFTGRRISGSALARSVVDEGFVVAGASWWDAKGWHDTSPPASRAGSARGEGDEERSRSPGGGLAQMLERLLGWRLLIRGALASPPLDAALAYASRGWAVFPLHSMISGRCSCRRDCPHPAKHPITRHGLRDATTEARRIRSWWDRFPWANVGITTGERSGIVVSDVDPARGGTESLAHLQRLMGSLPDTLTARTGGRGRHLCFVHPGGELRNTASRLPGVEEPLPGLDLRGDGGYVVAPPIRHASGRGYSWEDATVPVAPVPPWLREARRPVGTGRVPRRGTGETAPYGKAALEAEAEAVRETPPGGRNARLNRAAFSLGTLIGGRVLDAELVTAELLGAASDAGLGEAEAAASIASGLRAGARVPRVLTA